MKKSQKNILVVIEFIAILLSMWAVVPFDLLAGELFLHLAKCHLKLIIYYVLLYYQ